MAKPQRFLLASVAEPHHVADLADKFRLVVPAALLEESFELRRGVEMVLDGVLAPSRDNDDVLDPRGHALFDDILNQGLVHKGQHFLWLRLGGRKEPCSQPCCRQDRFSYALWLRGHGFQKAR